MKILDGKIVREKIADKLITLNSKLETKPKLVIIQVGDLAESNTYIRQKVLFGEKIGAVVEHQKLDEKISQENLSSILLTLNSNPSVHGIIVQLPIPKHLDKNALIDSINPAKDVDGQTPTNIKLLLEGSSSSHPEHSEGSLDSSPAKRGQNDSSKSPGFIPATTKGILTLLDYYKIPVSGKNITVVGRSSLVGKPTALALINRDATVTVCHSQTKNLAQVTKNADILIVAVGKTNLITADHVSKGQVVIDVGINVIDDGQSSIENSRKKIIGDVDFENVAKIVAAITPVPGGIGPLTVASLFENLLKAHSQT